MHCKTPACVSVCPVAALEKLKEGPVIYHASKCMGCRYCMMACPFQVPQYEWNNTLPKVRKCDFCIHRITKGMETACSWVCPMGATVSGEYDYLLNKARERIRYLKDRYVPHTYGENEVGGTSVLIISDVDFDSIGYSTDYSHDPLPDLTWKVLEKIPNIVLTAGLLLGGIWWIINRRMEMQELRIREEEKKQNSNKNNRNETLK
jgi:formate dehydrogenase iron-sulfur subunit